MRKKGTPKSLDRDVSDGVQEEERGQQGTVSLTKSEGLFFTEENPWSLLLFKNILWAMGNTHGQLKSSRFEAALHSSIEQSLRSQDVAPRPVFSQLYLDKQQGHVRPPGPENIDVKPNIKELEAAPRDRHSSASSTSGYRGNLPAEQPSVDQSYEDEEKEDPPGSPQQPYRFPTPPEGACQTPGYCQAGKDIRLTSLREVKLTLPEGFVLVGAKSPNLTNNILVAAVDARFLPNPKTNLALLGFSGNCIGCGEQGFRYFTEFSAHINMRLTTQPKKQKHLKYYIVRNNLGLLVRGPLVPWKVVSPEVRKRGFPMAPQVVSPLLSAAQGAQQATISYHANRVPASLLAAQQQHPSPQPRPSTIKYGGGGSPPLPNGPSPPDGSAQPPKKRHKGWGPGRPDTMSNLNLVMPPHPAMQAESVFIQPGLLNICCTKPVVLACHGNLPYLHGNVNDVVVSTLLVDCYKPVQMPPKLLEGLGLTNAPPLSVETMALLTVQYLVQLGNEKVPLREEFDAILLQARQESAIKDKNMQQHAQFLSVAPAQLPWLAKVAASASNGLVRIVNAQASLAEGISETLQMICMPQPYTRYPSFVVVIHVSRHRGTEFCVLVTGVHQARVVAESMLSASDCFKEISYEIITGKFNLLTSHFKEPNTAMSVPVKKHAAHIPGNSELDKLLDDFVGPMSGEVMVPYHGGELHRVREDIAKDMVPDKQPDSATDHQELHPVQIAVAMKILSQVCAIADSGTQSLDLGRFSKVDILVMVPPSNILYNQTVERLKQSGVLVDLGMETASSMDQKVDQYVMKCDSVAENQAKFESFVKHVRQHPYTLHVLIQDQAHVDVNRHSSGNMGLADKYINCKDFADAPNLLTLQVSASPFSLQTQKSRVTPHNEVFWPSNIKQNPNVPPEDTVYFGVSDYCRTADWSNHMPALRSDDSFEQMSTSLLAKYPKLHSMVIRTYILVRHYSAALMTIAGVPGAQEMTTTETLNMLQDVVNAPLTSPGGRGSMLLLRVPSIQLAMVAYDKLHSVRDKLGLQYRFDVILSSANTDLTLEEYFLKRMQAWRGELDNPERKSSWVPRTYCDLDGLPCILILCGKDPLGETMPRSLKYCDLRLVNHGHVTRASLEQEISLGCRYISRDVVNEPITVCDMSDEDSQSDSEMDNDDGDLQIDTDRPRSNSSDVQQTSPGFSGNQAQHHNGSVSDSTRNPNDNVGRSSPDSAQDSGKESQGNSVPEMSPQQPQASVTSLQGMVENSIDMIYGKEKNSNSHEGDADLPNEPFEQREAAAARDRSGTSPMASVKSSVSKDNLPTTSTSSVGQHKPSASRIAGSSLLPVTIIVSKTAYDILRPDPQGKQRHISLQPHPDVGWICPLRPMLLGEVTNEVQSAYYRQWTEPLQHHMDTDNKGENSLPVFHPRRLLLSGPPQVGKTGAYLQFLRVLFRMLIRLLEVEVYNEEEINMDRESPAVSLVYNDNQTTHLTAKWPDYEFVRSMPFDANLHEGKYTSCSPVYAGAEKKDNSPTVNKDSRRPTMSIMLSKFSAHNSFHHCEHCHHYMESVAPQQTRESSLYSFTFPSAVYGEEVRLHFIIPQTQEKHFVFSKQGHHLESLRLPSLEDAGHNDIKTPIFTPTCSRQEHGLLNLFHAMEGGRHTHMVVVKQCEMALYQKFWPNHIILVLPVVCNDAGIGAARFLVKELAYYNLELERNRQEELGVRRQDVWPYVIIMDDSLVMWNMHDSTQEDKQTQNISLKSVIQHLEATPKITHFSMLGARQWSGKSTVDVSMQPFSRCHLHSFIMLNVDATQNVQYDQNRYNCEDIDFNMRISSGNGLLCRFNRFSFMKKAIHVGGGMDFPMKPKVANANTQNITTRQFVAAPDSEDLVPLVAPPQFLLEKYLAHESKALFPMAMDNHLTPVLAIDCYLNLGAQISVAYMSSRPHSVNTDTDCRFSGLLLYLCDSFVMADFLKKFNFIPGATLCVICPDRNTLRRQIARLELEDQWRFRLRDEFQTANTAEDKPLYFLTGQHIAPKVPAFNDKAQWT
ncbi:GREB1-like protein isoform X2 [Branchiostoma floridae x Branchiostoma japonicum]